MAQDISEGRKTVAKIGLGMSGLGLLLFMSSFVTSAMHFGDFSDFRANARSDSLRAAYGMMLIVSGFIVIAVASGSIPGAKQRFKSGRPGEDSETLNPLMRDVAADRLDEAEGHSGAALTQIVKIRCRYCGGLSDEATNFCQGCGARL